MLVKALILRLQECDQEAMVVVDGYEGGVTELRNIRDSVEIALDVNEASYYGEHECVFSNGYPDAVHKHVVYLPR